MQRVYMGDAKSEYKNYPDCNRWELAALVPLGICSILFGVLPSLVLDVYRTTTDVFLKLF